MTSLTAFGQDGPYKDYRSNDLVALAMGGIMHSCGYDDVPNSPPIRPSGGHGDFISAHYGLIGTMSALFPGILQVSDNIWMFQLMRPVPRLQRRQFPHICSSIKKFSAKQEGIKERHQLRKPFAKPSTVNT